MIRILPAVRGLSKKALSTKLRDELTQLFEKCGVEFGEPQ